MLGVSQLEIFMSKFHKMSQMNTLALSHWYLGAPSRTETCSFMKVLIIEKILLTESLLERFKNDHVILKLQFQNLLPV
jgi:hypothetical protein